jgi:hypothetical protein
MAHLRNFFAAATLTFVLAGATLADDGIIYGGYNPKPTPTPTPLAQLTDTGVADLPAAAEPSSNEVTATEIAIESVLRVFGDMFLLY